MSNPKLEGLEQVPVGALRAWIASQQSSIKSKKQQIKEQQHYIDVWQEELNKREDNKQA